MKGFFITATDTEVGKTIVTSAIAKNLNKKYKVGVFKPVQSGAEHILASDAGYLWWAIGERGKIEDVVPYSFKEPVAPLVAADLAGVNISIENIKNLYKKTAKESQLMLVEGAGGFLVPITKGKMIADIAKEFNLPLLIIARPNLGTINHTLLTIEAAKSRDLKIAGVIINGWKDEKYGPAEFTAPGLMEEYSGIPVIGKLPKVHGKNDKEIISNLAVWMENNFDWGKLEEWII